MNISVTKQQTQISYRNQNTAKALECLFLTYLIYSLTAVPLGINVPYLAGGWLSVLAFIAFFSVDWKKSARIPMVLIFAIAFSFLFIQFFVHEMSFSLPYMRSIYMWIPLALVIFILSGRPGFIKRLAVVMFSIGLFLRFFIITKMDIIARQRLDSGSGIDNSNDYAAWMGFCALVFWLWGWNSAIKSRRLLLRVLFAVATLFLLGTVSRSALLSLSVGILLGFRNIPKRKWLLGLIILCLSFFTLQALSTTFVTNYQARFYEESGRFSRWPIAIKSIQISPWWGYGVERVAHKGAGIDITPHNGILFLWLASGFVPVVFFILLWGLAIIRGYKGIWLVEGDIDGLPLILFAFLEMLTSNVYFSTLWASTALFYCFREELDGEQIQPPLMKRKFTR